MFEIVGSEGEGKHRDKSKICFALFETYKSQKCIYRCINLQKRVK